MAMEKKIFIKDGKAVGVIGSDEKRCRSENGTLLLLRDERWGNPLFADASLDEADFHIHARITLDRIAGTGASILLGGHYHYNHSRAQGNYSFRICFDQDIHPAQKEILNKDMYIVYGGTNPRKYWHADEYMSEKQVFDPSRKHIEEGKPFDVDLIRKGNDLILEINGKVIFCIPFHEEIDPMLGRNGSNGYFVSTKLGDIITAGRSGDTGWPVGLGFFPDFGDIKIHDFYAEGCFTEPVFPATDAWEINTEDYSMYRMPSVCLTPKGRLLAFSEARRSFLTRGWECHVNTGSELLSADLHSAVKSSEDGGKTWSKQTIIPTLDKGFTYHAHYPSPVSDFDTGEIFVFTRGPCVISSKDDGVTWSEVTPLSKSLPAGWEGLKAGCGNCATQIRNGKYKGRLIAGLIRTNVVCLIYSDDHGKSWKPGAFESDIVFQSAEPSLAELSDGRLAVSPRQRGGTESRMFLISEDGGETFSEKRYCPEVTMFGQGEIVAFEKFEVKGKGKVRPIVCAGSVANKTKLTIMISLDDCETWPISKVIDESHATNLGLVAMPEGMLGILYERDKYHRLSFARVDIAEIIKEADNV